MRVAVFLVFVSLLMLRGYDSIYAGTHHISLSHTPAQYLESKPQVKSAYQHYIVTAVTSLNEEEEFLISDDIAEEDPDNFLARKYKLLVNYYLALSYLLILSYLYKYLKSPSSYWGHLSNIYITQNVLRI
jgi:hypothetical protein